MTDKEDMTGAWLKMTQLASCPKDNPAYEACVGQLNDIRKAYANMIVGPGDGESDETETVTPAQAYAVLRIFLARGLSGPGVSAEDAKMFRAVEKTLTDVFRKAGAFDAGENPPDGDV